MKYLIIQAYIADSMLRSIELSKYSLISHINKNINKARLKALEDVSKLTYQHKM
jgi:hypothetical protein